jgi:predicted nucleic acid-binding protein
MNFVVDSSFALAWVLKDETTPETDKVLNSLGQGAKAFVPALWRWEMANALLMVERRKRATIAEINGHLLLLRSLPIELDETAYEQAWSVTFSLAQKHKLTSYDAAYLELAMRRLLPLGTLDSELAAAAKMEKVELLPAK